MKNFVVFLLLSSFLYGAENQPIIDFGLINPYQYCVFSDQEIQGFKEDLIKERDGILQENLMMPLDGSALVVKEHLDLQQKLSHKGYFKEHFLSNYDLYLNSPYYSADFKMCIREHAKAQESLELLPNCSNLKKYKNLWEVKFDQIAAPMLESISEVMLSTSLSSEQILRQQRLGHLALIQSQLNFYDNYQSFNKLQDQEQLSVTNQSQLSVVSSMTPDVLDQSLTTHSDSLDDLKSENEELVKFEVTILDLNNLLNQVFSKSLDKIKLEKSFESEQAQRKIIKEKNRKIETDRLKIKIQKDLLAQKTIEERKLQSQKDKKSYLVEQNLKETSHEHNVSRAIDNQKQKSVSEKQIKKDTSNQVKAAQDNEDMKLLELAQEKAIKEKNHMKFQMIKSDMNQRFQVALGGIKTFSTNDIQKILVMHVTKAMNEYDIPQDLQQISINSLILNIMKSSEALSSDAEFIKAYNIPDEEYDYDVSNIKKTYKMFKQSDAYNLSEDQILSLACLDAMLLHNVIKLQQKIKK